MNPHGPAGRPRKVSPPGTANDHLTVPLYRLAHGRTGDKGDRANVSVIAWHPDLWDVLVEQLTEAAVAQSFATRKPSAVRRYLLPQLQAMNFVLDGVLDGGVNSALNLDSHGKCLSYLLLDRPMQVPRALLHLLAGPHDFEFSPVAADLSSVQLPTLPQGGRS